MFPTTVLFCPDEALKLAQERQAQLRSEFEAINPEEAAQRRFLRKFQLRRALNRWAPRVASWFL